MKTITSQVILASGELYPKSNLHPGMTLLGADAKPQELKGMKTRKILAFEVQPQKETPFLLGFDQRILAFSKYQEPLLLRAMDVRDCSKNFLKNFGLAKATLDFPKQELPLDPYFLGLLLGDGCFRKSTICLTTPDTEIIQALYQTAAQHQWPVRVERLPRNLSDGYYFKKSPKNTPSLKQILASLGLFRHKSTTKFIPKNYVYADRTSREALLAGLLDTDGSLRGFSYDYQTSSLQLAEDVAFLARSLGLLVVEGKSLKTRGIVARLYLHGDFSQIPLRIQRKISHPRRKPFQATFKLKPVGLQEILYLDIESYLQGDFTIRIGDPIRALPGGSYDNA